MTIKKYVLVIFAGAFVTGAVLALLGGVSDSQALASGGLLYLTCRIAVVVDRQDRTGPRTRAALDEFGRMARAQARAFERAAADADRRFR